MDFAQLSGSGQIKLSTTPKAITPFAGLASFIAWLRQIGFYKQAAGLMPFSYASPNAIPLADTLCAFLFSVTLGASRFAHCDWLRFDSALHAMLGIARFPATDAILRFFGRFTQGRIEAFFRPLGHWLVGLLTPPRRRGGASPRHCERPSAERCWGGRGANWCYASRKTEGGSPSTA